MFDELLSSKMGKSNSLLKSFFVVGLVLAIPAIPFFLLGEPFEQALSGWLESRGNNNEVFWGVVGLLGMDILLPVPSSAVNTLAGAKLGWGMGTLAAWLGMTLGACLGFQLARWLGRSLAHRLVNSADLAALESRAPGWQVGLLLLTRPLPIIAEAGVVLLGCLGLSWREFLPPLLISHGVIACLYAGLGAWAHSTQNTGWVTVLSMFLPLAVTGLVRTLWLRSPGTPVNTPDTDTGPNPG